MASLAGQGGGQGGIVKNHENVAIETVRITGRRYQRVDAVLGVVEAALAVRPDKNRSTGHGLGRRRWPSLRPAGTDINHVLVVEFPQLILRRIVMIVDPWRQIGASGLGTKEGYGHRGALLVKPGEGREGVFSSFPGKMMIQGQNGRLPGFGLPCEIEPGVVDGIGNMNDVIQTHALGHFQ